MRVYVHRVPQDWPRERTRQCAHELLKTALLRDFGVQAPLCYAPPKPAPQCTPMLTPTSATTLMPAFAGCGSVGQDACPQGRIPPKPTLAGSDLQVNLSHTQGCVACAIGRVAVGVDVQAADRLITDALVARVLAPSEALLRTKMMRTPGMPQSLETQQASQSPKLWQISEPPQAPQLPEALRKPQAPQTPQSPKTPCTTDPFFAFWALKESVLKYTGQGLAGGMRRVVFEKLRQKGVVPCNHADIDVYYRTNGPIHVAVCVPHGEPIKWCFSEE